MEVFYEVFTRTNKSRRRGPIPGDLELTLGNSAGFAGSEVGSAQGGQERLTADRSVRGAAAGLFRKGVDRMSHPRPSEKHDL